MDNENMDSRYVVAIGNPFDGLALHGPFETSQDALDWAENLDEWFIVEIREPL